MKLWALCTLQMQHAHKETANLPLAYLVHAPPHDKLSSPDNSIQTARMRTFSINSYTLTIASQQWKLTGSEVLQQEAYPAIKPLLMPKIWPSVGLSPQIEDLSKMWLNCHAKFHVD